MNLDVEEWLLYNIYKERKEIVLYQAMNCISLEGIAIVSWKLQVEI